MCVCVRVCVYVCVCVCVFIVDFFSEQFVFSCVTLSVFSVYLFCFYDHLDLSQM